ncbi:hypothetical protein AB0D49_15485 [Streptomyces sp. NPDC048290]|uniref:hypothetical protein n=1 Tax=Streptomyces sp. NPDC048290 TaxID=3155811 RepID=UPI003437A2C4
MTSTTVAPYELSDQALDQMAGGSDPVERWWDGNTAFGKYGDGSYRAVNHDTGDVWESSGDGQPYEFQGNFYNG